MASWTGWAKDVLAELGAPVTDRNRAFLTEWQKAEATTCPFNPLSVRSLQPGAIRCHELSNGDYARAYPSKAVGLAATVEQLNNKHYATIKDALVAGDPFSYNDAAKVVSELDVWAAHRFAVQYASELTPPPPGAGQGQDLGTAYLEGGRCDGNTHKITAAERDANLIKCKGSNYYRDVPHKTHGSDQVWAFIGNDPAPSPSPGAKAAKLHKGYADIQHSVNHNLPAALRASKRSLDAGLRALHRASKVPL